LDTGRGYASASTNKNGNLWISGGIEVIIKTIILELAKETSTIILKITVTKAE
jgi:hypothetical protein